MVKRKLEDSPGKAARSPTSAAVATEQPCSATPCPQRAQQKEQQSPSALGTPGLPTPSKTTKARRSKVEYGQAPETQKPEDQKQAVPRPGPQPHEQAPEAQKLSWPAAASSTPPLTAAPTATSAAQGVVAAAAAARGEDLPVERKKKWAGPASYQELADELIEGEPGHVSPRLIPLKLLTKHQSVAWQWEEEGEWLTAIPIGCCRPLSPFDSECE